MEIFIPAGSYDGIEILGVRHSFLVMPDIPNKSELVHWWWMDDAKGTEIEDSVNSSAGTLIEIHIGPPMLSITQAFHLVQAGIRQTLGL